MSIVTDDKAYGLVWGESMEELLVHSMLYVRNHEGGKTSVNDCIGVAGYIRSCELLMESLRVRGGVYDSRF